MKTYRQVKLERPRAGATTFITCWARADQVRLYRRVTLDGQDGVWVITEVYEGTLTGDELAALHGEHRDSPCWTTQPF